MIALILTVNNTCFAKAYNTFLDLTDGAWNTLTIASGGTGSASVVAINSIYDITLDRFLSIPDTTETSNTTTVQYSRPSAMMYNWFKFKSFRLSLKNFMVIIERDSTGGIQALDEPIFEVRKIFSRQINGLLSVGNIPQLGGQRFTLTDLQKGLNVSIPFQQHGWMNYSQLGKVETGIQLYNDL